MRIFFQVSMAQCNYLGLDTGQTPLSFPKDHQFAILFWLYISATFECIAFFYLDSGGNIIGVRNIFICLLCMHHSK